MLNDREFEQAWRGRRDWNAPADERQDAERQAFSHVMDHSMIRRFQEDLPQDVSGGQHMLADIEKAIRQHARTRPPELGTKRQSLFDDPLIAWTPIQGLLPRMGRIPPALLRSMARQNPIKASILQIITNRTLRHADFVEDGVQAMLTGAEGWSLFPTFKPASEGLTEAEVMERSEIVNFVMNSGHVARFTGGQGPNREDLRRESFDQMLAHQVKQRFVLDARSIELERSRNGRRLVGMYAVDGATIGRTDPRDWPRLPHPEASSNPRAAFAQVWRNQIVTSFGSEDLYYDFANPSDEIGQRGYGMSEVEMSIKLTTGILNILTTNNAIFDRGALPPGILSIMGQISQESLNAIRDEWDAYRLGAGGQWGMPMVNIRDPQGKMNFLRTDGNPSEMVFSAYVNFLSAIDCAMFGVDVTEVNVSAFGGNNAGLSSGKDTQTRIDESKNRSFLPWMARLARTYNEILQPNWDYRWRFGFVGLQRQDPKELRDTFMQVATVDEVRQTVFNLSPIGGLAGESLAKNPGVAQMTLAAIGKGAADRNGDGKIDIKEAGQATDTPRGARSAADAPPRPR